MPDPLAHSPDMITTIRPNTKPPLWWLYPWSYARTLHTAANALRNLCDRQDALLKGKYTTRPRWVIEHWVCDHGTSYRYYFRDTDPELDRAKETSVLRGKAFLYDGPSKSFVYETDPAEAIERVTELNR